MNRSSGPLSSLVGDRDPLVAMRALTALYLLGEGGYREAVAQSLRRKGGSEYEELVQVNQEQLGAPALLTLLLGLPSDREEPRRIVATGVMQALDYLSQRDVDRGFLFRALRNIDALAAAGHDWIACEACPKGEY